MEEEDKTSIPTAEDSEAELEFRPWVKWCAVGLAGAASLGFFLLTYYVGYAQGEDSGFQKATESGLVQESLNEAASQNVLNFMRLASASDAHLLQAAANTDAAFSWVKDAGVRQEAEWSLACALLERRLADSAVAVLEPLMKGVPQSAEWGYRSLKAADLLAGMQQYKSASLFYKQADGIFTANKLEKERLTTLGQIIAMVMAAPQSAEQINAALGELYSELQSIGQAAQPLCSVILVHQGVLARGLGDAAGAGNCFRKALDGVDTASVTDPVLAACYGTALLELGDAVAAEPLLKIAVNAANTSPADIAARLLALRELAIIESHRGHNVTALALLHRAHGVAEGRIPENNSFWPSLYDQRGWMHYQVQNYQTALLDFTSALTATGNESLLYQSQEGAGRCHLELGRVEQALPLLQSCLKLRQTHASGDKDGIGRINLLLAQIYDQQGKVAEAVSAYTLAVANLSGESPEGQANRRLALFGQAYALTELQRWAEAYAAWEQLLPMVEGETSRVHEVRQQMRRAKSLIPTQPTEQQSEPAAP